MAFPIFIVIYSNYITMLNEKKKCLLAIFKFVIIFYLLSLLFATLFAFASFDDKIGRLQIEIIGLIIAFTLLELLIRQEKKDSFGLWNFSGQLNWKIVIGSVLLGIVMFSNTILFGHLLNHPVGHEDFNITRFLLNLLSSVFLIAFAEELFNRKMVITYMKRSGFSTITIVLFSSLLFYLNHVNWFLLDFHRIDTLIAGIVLYFLYTKTHDIRYCMIVHAMINLFLAIYQIWLV